MRSYLSFISLVVLFCFVSALIPKMVYAAEVGTCRKARNEREERNAPHLFFLMDTGKKLLLELKGLRISKRKLTLIDTKLTLYKEREEWFSLQIKTCDKTVDRLAKSLVSKNQQLTAAQKESAKKQETINKLTVDVVKYKGERYQWMMYGIGGTVLLFAIGFIAFGIYSAVSAK